MEETSPLSSASADPFVLSAHMLGGTTADGKTVEAMFERVAESSNWSVRNKHEQDFEAELAQRRLGIASSLFLALRARHAPSAAHCMRVALACSAWAADMNMPDDERDDLEIVALLHDVGKMGIPDSILLKPHKLADDEAARMEQHWQHAVEILGTCFGSPGVLNMLRYCGARYDGRKPGYDLQGEQLPIGSRMLAIVDAFDSMTTDHIYRRAMSRERAIAELFECAGTQFDPHLVRNYSQLLLRDEAVWTATVARRWLRQLQADDSHVTLQPSVFREAATRPAPGCTPHASGFHQRLLESMHDGVMFVDRDQRITLWNRAAERLTGIPASSVLSKQFLPSLLHMQVENGTAIPDDECPIAAAVNTGVQTLKRLSITGRKGRRFVVNLHLVPVMDANGERKGAAVLMHDASSQITLEERVQLLHQRATQDPLTKVANRAEFDRVLAEFVATHLREGAPCSLIICDIDHFKRVNDVHGHQAGDEALVSFASILRSFCRPGDLVARYGGEEFVLLCADCDNATATRRAEEVRRAIAATTLPSLGGRTLTASFGVTEIQAGDTPEMLIRRADRALLQAKDTGRNRVVQLGTGMHIEEEFRSRRRWWTAWLHQGSQQAGLERDLVTSVPLNLAVEKLRGFISDHHAEVLELESNRILLRIDGPYTPLLRRHGDRAAPLFVEMSFEELEAADGDHGPSRTLVHVSVRGSRKRERRKRDLEQRTNQLLISIKSYFMAQELPANAVSRPASRADLDLNQALKGS